MTSQVRRHERELVPSVPSGSPDMLTPRLLVRHYQPADVEAIREAIDESRPSLARWVPDIARLRTSADIQAGLESLAAERDQGKRLVFGLWERASRSFLGEVGLYELDWNRRSAEVGYWLRQSARGHGYAAEALERVRVLASRDLKLRQLEAHIAVDNTPSHRVVQQQGFRVRGERPGVPYWDGEVASVLIYTRPLGTQVL